MNISVIGNGHLAYVTAACMEQFHRVNVDKSKVNESQLIWICYDTPVNLDGVPQMEYIFLELDTFLKNVKDGSVVLVSSQVPVGTCKTIQSKYPALDIACSPENLRRGKAIHDFMNPERIIVGTNGKESTMNTIDSLLSPLNREIMWMGVESAEMVKHALNGFLALSISYINEISKVCAAVGANPSDVADGLQTDKRIGKLSYLRPGGPYTNDTLGREIHNLMEFGKKYSLYLNLINSIKMSNDAHSNNRQ